jgi:MoxR-like ATPase
MVQAGQALALLRGRRHVLTEDVRDLAFDVLRHRLVLSYDALSDGVTADDILTRVVDTLSSGATGTGTGTGNIRLTEHDAA